MDCIQLLANPNSFIENQVGVKAQYNIRSQEPKKSKKILRKFINKIFSTQKMADAKTIKIASNFINLTQKTLS